MDIYQILHTRPTVEKKELQALYSRMFDTYQIVASFSDDPAVVEIANAKIQLLIVEGEKAGLRIDNVEMGEYVSTNQDISAIRLALNSSRADPATLGSYNISGRIDALPESAEKHFLKAIVHIKLDSQLAGCQAAVSELQKALEADPGNSAYLAFLDAIVQQVDQYEERQKRFAEEAEQNRIQMERQSQRAVDAARRERFWNNAAPLMGVIGYAFLCSGVCCCCCNALDAPCC